MKKKDFMDELKAALDGNVSTQTYYDTVNYYEEYFRKQKEAGKSEDEICTSLGSARLIAKTIIDTEGQGASGRYYDSETESYARESRRTGESSQKGWHINVDDEGNTSFAYGKLDFSSPLGKVLTAIVLVLAAALVIGIVLGVIWLGFKIVWYVVIPVVIILFIVNLIIYLFGGGKY
ncbi:MAG: DUF1700 domain-containing protein [Clostridiales bacterium]|nr:DUF1700 domain-containing protein [Clostridiales bacterium]